MGQKFRTKRPQSEPPVVCEDKLDQNQTSEIPVSSEANENLGDPVDYSVVVNGVELDDWSIFYQENGQTDLIYDDLLPNATQLAADAGLKQGTGVYSEYGVYSDVSRNDFLNKLNDVRDSQLWSGLLTPELADLGATAKGGVDLETWAKSWNSKGYEQLTLSTIDFSDGTQGYIVNGLEMLNLSSDVEGYSDPLYFPPINDSSSTDNPYYGYWIASPSGMANGYLMIATDDGKLGDNIHGFRDAEGVGLRPIISLPTENLVQTTDDSHTWRINTNTNTNANTNTYTHTPTSNN